MNAWNDGSHGGLNSNSHQQINENNITPGGMNSVPIRSEQGATAGGMYGIHVTANIAPTLNESPNERDETGPHLRANVVNNIFVLVAVNLILTN